MVVFSSQTPSSTSPDLPLRMAYGGRCPEASRRRTTATLYCSRISQILFSLLLPRHTPAVVIFKRTGHCFPPESVYLSRPHRRLQSGQGIVWSSFPNSLISLLRPLAPQSM